MQAHPCFVPAMLCSMLRHNLTAVEGKLSPNVAQAPRSATAVLHPLHLVLSIAHEATLVPCSRTLKSSSAHTHTSMKSLALKKACERISSSFRNSKNTAFLAACFLAASMLQWSKHACSRILQSDVLPMTYLASVSSLGWITAFRSDNMRGHLTCVPAAFFFVAKARMFILGTRSMLVPMTMVASRMFPFPVTTATHA